MRDQLESLAKTVRSNRRVRLQVLPLEHGVNSGMGGAFLLATFVDDRPAAVLDNLLSGQMMERRVEVARCLPGRVAVRDSKDPEGPRLVFTPAGWQAFTSQVKAGQHHLT